MAVRRLAPDAIQPATFAFSEENRRWAEGQIAKYPAGRQASAVIPLLWQAQKQAGGWLPRAAIEHVARTLDMPNIRVLEVATFYTMFNLEPVGRYYIQLCGTTPCVLRGAEDIRKVCRERIGPQHHVTADGNFSWIETECLGACCNAPMVQINDDYFEDLTPESFSKLLDDLAAGRPVKPGPQNGRRSSEPKDAVATLTDAALYDGSVVGAWRKRFEEAAPAAPAAPAPAPAESKPAVAAAAPAAAAPARPASEPPTGATADTPADSGAAAKAKGSAGGAAHAAGETASATPPAAPADGPAEAAPAVSAEKEALAKAEEAEIAAKIAALPKGASAEDKANAVGARPTGLAAARSGAADDLKRIRGIGKVNEGKLNGLGIFHFDQIAQWTRQEIRWVGTYLAFPGRIDREDWVGQAKGLATAGVTDSAKRVDKGDVPTSKG